MQFSLSSDEYPLKFVNFRAHGFKVGQYFAVCYTEKYIVHAFAPLTRIGRLGSQYSIDTAVGVCSAATMSQPPIRSHASAEENRLVLNN